MPSLENRATLENMMQNEDIIPTELLYRPMDANFGKNKKIETLFLHGLQPSTLSEYASALYENFYEKKLWLGNIKTARALDKHGKVLYEVVYSTLVDDLINVEQTSISKMQMLPLEVETTEGATHWVYPNSIYNMQKQLSSAIPQIAPSALPLWMTSKQSSGNVLGYTMAWVICYTKPNESEKVAYRLRNKYSQELNKLYFTINRFVTDMTMSLNYNKATDRWKEGNITTFDRSDRPSGISFAMQVDFATELPFAMINSRTPAEIFAIGGIDGEITDYNNRTIIFLNQEDYTDFGMTINDGWIDYNSAMEEHPFDSHRLDEYSVVPTDGFSGSNIINNRLGVFKFVKSNGIYHLEHVRNFTNAEYVQVLYGKSHRNNDFFIPMSPAPGSTMITWRAILKVQRKETIFDMQGTRFISPVDKYSTNNQLMKYVAFPKKNILG
jgi:hypothetical protein